MKLHTKKHILKGLTVIILSLSTFMTNGQSNTPCGAPVLPVNSGCVNTAGTTTAATYQNNAANGGTPTCASPGAPDVWYSFVAPASGSVTITTSAGNMDTGLGLYNGPCTAPTQIACDDDGGVGTYSSISNGSLTPGVTYYLRIWRYSSGTGDFNICVQGASAPPTNTSCSVPDPICSGSPIVFTAQSNGTAASTVNPGNDYDCLFTSPNPSWYYLEIASGGNLAIDITAGSDIDFELWGPFPSYANAVANCNSYGVPIDCSYSISATEQANAAGVVAGEVYVLLVTNYANTVQTITLADAAGNTATTDCSIVPLSVELTSFDGSFNESMSEVKLNWQTSSERDNSHFVIERSEDTKQWTGVGIQTGSGTTTNTSSYEMIDNNPYSGESYYRLKQFDYDGKMTTSDIIQVNRTIENKIQLFPNPTKDAITVNSNNEIISVKIIDLQGSVVFNQDQVLQKITRIDLSNLRDGMYYASIETEKGTTIERISVIK